MTKIYTKDGVDSLLAQKATLTDLGNETTNRQAADAALESNFNAALTSKADLVGGVIPTSQIPALALVKAIPVASQAAMLALTSNQVQPGDLAIRTDGAGTFILTEVDPSVLANWLLLNSPTDVVTSVNGQTGTVVLAKADLGLGNVDNTSDVNKPISTATQAALDLKAAKIRPTTTKTGTTYTFVLADAETWVELDNAAANTATVPPNSAAAFPVGTTIKLRQYGVGQTTLAAGAGVTVRSLAGALKIAGQYGEVTLTKRATDEWVASGDLVV